MLPDHGASLRQREPDVPELRAHAGGVLPARRARMRALRHGLRQRRLLPVHRARVRQRQRRLSLSGAVGARVLARAGAVQRHSARILGRGLLRRRADAEAVCGRVQRSRGAVRVDVRRCGPAPEVPEAVPGHDRGPLPEEPSARLQVTESRMVARGVEPRT